ncbi:hypothetical protein [Nostoc commune]|uniref:hypothetical protein n=1 Tax=Nostoc commune TaxID=1178 RepID=UPI0015E7EFF0|nr:hypothetical protein [Nostoc commune]
MQIRFTVQESTKAMVNSLVCDKSGCECIVNQGVSPVLQEKLAIARWAIANGYRW